MGKTGNHSRSHQNNDFVDQEEQRPLHTTSLQEKDTVPKDIKLLPPKGYQEYGSTGYDDHRNDNTDDDLLSRPIRCQVVVWYVGPINVVLGTFPMKFRLTVFWSAPTDEEHAQMATTGYGTYDASNKRVWKMEGRQRAYQKELDEIMPGSNLVYVPPISILNAVDFSLVGEPEVCLVDEAERRMKWTCMYKASLIQEHMRVTRYVVFRVTFFSFSFFICLLILQQ